MSTDTHQVTMRPLDAVKPYASNPRFNEAAIERVAELIREYGFTQPILLDPDNVIIAGHSRYLAARQVGLEQVPTITLSHLTPEQVRAYRIADNRSAEYSTWNWLVLGDELTELSRAGVDLSTTAFPDSQIEQILESLETYTPGSSQVNASETAMADAAARLAAVANPQGSRHDVECPKCGHPFSVEV